MKKTLPLRAFTGSAWVFLTVAGLVGGALVVEKPKPPPVQIAAATDPGTVKLEITIHLQPGVQPAAWPSSTYTMPELRGDTTPPRANQIAGIEIHQVGLRQ